MSRKFPTLPGLDPRGAYTVTHTHTRKRSCTTIVIHQKYTNKRQNTVHARGWLRVARREAIERPFAQVHMPPKQDKLSGLLVQPTNLTHMDSASVFSARGRLTERR